MNPRQFLRIKKLTGKEIIEVAARHNHREIHAEIGAAQDGKIDAALFGLNRVLRGHDTAKAVASHARILMDAAGVKSLRRDAVRALELVVSVRLSYLSTKFNSSMTLSSGRTISSPRR